MDALIKTVKHFIRISSEEETIISDLFAESHLKPGEYFLEEGKVCRSVAFIEKGLLRYFVTQDGNEKTIYFNKENEFACNYSSFLPGKPSDTSIQALEETTLSLISYDNLQRLYADVKEGERFGRLAIEQVFLAGLEQIRSLYADPPPARYQQFLAIYPDLVQRIPQYYVASYVGVKPQSLSRIRKRLAAR
jgi:CRP-like cAMP-binding protein